MEPHEYTSLQRNSFARETTIRVTVPKNERKLCKWCGSRPGRFRYGVMPDSGRTFIANDAFCSKDCNDSFKN